MGVRIPPPLPEFERCGTPEVGKRKRTHGNAGGKGGRGKAAIRTAATRDRLGSGHEGVFSRRPRRTEKSYVAEPRRCHLNYGRGHRNGCVLRYLLGVRGMAGAKGSRLRFEVLS